MECLEKRGFMLFPSSWFFLNNFNDGIFLWELLLLRLAVQFARGLDAGGRAACTAILVSGFGVAFDIWLGEPREVHRLYFSLRILRSGFDVGRPDYLVTSTSKYISMPLLDTYLGRQSR